MPPNEESVPSPRVTRAASKRAASLASQQPHAKCRRLTNNNNNTHQGVPPLEKKSSASVTAAPSKKRSSASVTVAPLKKKSLASVAAAPSKKKSSASVAVAPLTISVTDALSKKSPQQSNASISFTPQQAIVSVPKRKGKRPVIVGIPNHHPVFAPRCWRDIAIDTHAELGIDAPNFEDIYHYLKSMEVMPKFRPKNYIVTVQKDVTVEMRAFMVSKLSGFTRSHCRSTDALCHCVSYIDRFLSRIVISLDKFELLAISAMRLAMQYDEMFPPCLLMFQFFVKSPQPYFSKKQVVDMVNQVFKCLNYEIGNPTVITFVRMFVRAETDDVSKINWQLEFMGCYLAELSLLDYTLIKFLPSLVAAAVVFVARFTLHPDQHPWSKRMQEWTGYKVSLLKDCISAIRDLHQNKKKSNLMLIRNKYRWSKFESVSMIIPPSKIPAIYLKDITV